MVGKSNVTTWGARASSGPDSMRQHARVPSTQESVLSATRQLSCILRSFVLFFSEGHLVILTGMVMDCLLPGFLRGRNNKYSSINSIFFANSDGARGSDYSDLIHDVAELVLFKFYASAYEKKR